MKQRRFAVIGAMVLVFSVVLVVFKIGNGGNVDEAAASPSPVLSVVMTQGQMSLLPTRIAVSGNIAAWQEASIGTEAEGLRLTEVKVNVGDSVRQGQILALFKPDMVAADLTEARALVVQAEAKAAEAEANAQRARTLDGSGAMSAQQVDQYVVAAKTARAGVDAVGAIEQRHRVRLAQTKVLAPSDGIITSRTATVGAVMPAGQELFRLIKDGRLEWRANVAMKDIDELVPGQQAEIVIQGQPVIRGTLRMVAPAIDALTHTGLVYVDLPLDGVVRAGAFARGHVEVGEGQVLTVPQAAVLQRDGFNYVMRLGPKSNVMMTKVSVGRRVGDRVEITEGLNDSESIIASGLGFLSEGDTVRVVSKPAADTETLKSAAQGSDAP